jgi:hypothetical protein
MVYLGFKLIGIAWKTGVLEKKGGRGVRRQAVNKAPFVERLYGIMLFGFRSIAGMASIRGEAGYGWVLNFLHYSFSNYR